MIKQFQDHSKSSENLKYEVNYLVYNFEDHNLKAKLEKLDDNENGTKRIILNKYEINRIITNFTERY